MSLRMHELHKKRFLDRCWRSLSRERSKILSALRTIRSSGSPELCTHARRKDLQWHEPDSMSAIFTSTESARELWSELIPLGDSTCPERIQKPDARTTSCISHRQKQLLRN